MLARKNAGHPVGCRCRRCLDAWADDVLRAAGDRARGTHEALPPDVGRIALLALAPEDWTALQQWVAPDERIGGWRARRRTETPETAPALRRDAIRDELASYLDVTADDPLGWTVRDDRAFDPLGGGAIRDRSTGWAWVTPGQAATALGIRERTVRRMLASNALPTLTGPDGVRRVAFDALDTAAELTDVLAGRRPRYPRSAPPAGTGDRPAGGAVTAILDRTRRRLDRAIGHAKAVASGLNGAAGRS